MRRILLALVILIMTKGVGISEEIPSWFASVKTSESPYLYTSSGVWLTEYLVLTCYHTVRTYDKNTDQLTVVDYEGNKYHNVVVVKVDADADLSLLRIRGGLGHQGEKMIVSRWWQNQGPVTCWGWNTAVTEILTTKGVTLEGKWSSRSGRVVGFTHSAHIEQGMSGGPVINDSGRLVGVNSSRGESYSYATNLTTIQQFLDDLQ